MLFQLLEFVSFCQNTHPQVHCFPEVCLISFTMVHKARRTRYFHYLIVPLLNFWSWDSKCWPPRILRQSSALGLASLTALLSPDLSFIQMVHKVAQHFLEVLEGLGLDLPDVSLP